MMNNDYSHIVAQALLRNVNHNIIKQHLIVSKNKSYWDKKYDSIEYLSSMESFWYRLNQIDFETVISLSIEDCYLPHGRFGLSQVDKIIAIRQLAENFLRGLDIVGNSFQWVFLKRQSNSERMLEKLL